MKVELREKIARELLDDLDEHERPVTLHECLKAADRILAMPEIAEALGRSYKGMVIVEDASLKPGEMKLVQPPNV